MLTRRRMIAAALAAPALRAQIGYREYARCLPDYLSSPAAEAYARRNRRVAALRTLDEIRAYQTWACATFTRLVGALPERSPLNVRTAGAFEHDRYRVEKLVANIVPGALAVGDLPQMARSLAPRRVMAGASWDVAARIKAAGG